MFSYIYNFAIFMYVCTHIYAYIEMSILMYIYIYVRVYKYAHINETTFVSCESHV